MHGCSDERGRTNGRMRLYICTVGFFEPLESHTVRFTAWIIGHGIPRRLRSFSNYGFQRASSILACCLTYCGYYNSDIRTLQLSIWQLDFNLSCLSWSRGNSDFTLRENTFHLAKQSRSRKNWDH